MIEINLLPPERKKKKRAKLELPKGTLIFIGFGILGVLVIVDFSLRFLIHSKKVELRRLNRQWEDRLPLKQEADGLKAEINRMRKRKTVIEGLTKRELYWSKKMSLISDLIPMGVWLTELSIEKRQGKRFLTLEGVAMPFEDQEMIALVTTFMESLKKNEDFISDFENIELGPIKRARVENIEVMKFTLFCGLKRNSK